MLKVSNLSFSYDQTPVLNKVSFSVNPGEYLSVIGESGSGKSTLLKLIYGLLPAAGGSISWKGKELLGPNYHLVPGEDFMKYQAQDFDLHPSLTVKEHVGKHLSNFYLKKKKERTEELLELVGLEGMEDRKPRELSGGQQQRLSLARALARKPELLLLDEPFSNIDNFLRNRLRTKIFEFLKRENIACIVATHDNADSLAWADQTMVLRRGKVLALEHPQRLYAAPPSRYVAQLFGEVNELPYNLLYPESPELQKILIYPHQLEVADHGSLGVKVRKAYFAGSHWQIHAKAGRRNVLFNHNTALEPGSVIRLKKGED